MTLSLNRVKSLKDLAAYTPKLLELHGSLEGKWEPELNQQEFFLALIDNFDNPESYYFGQLVDGELSYFVTLIPHSPKKTMFWLFYMNPKFRSETKEILHGLKEYMKARGYTTAYTQSTRTSSSYERWLEKFGAEKLAITYKFNLLK